MIRPSRRIGTRTSTCREPGLEEARRYTRRLALTHYENFVVGGLLTPKHLRQDFYNIYAYCRMADDLADEVGDKAESLRLLDEWQHWLVDCYEGRHAQHPVFVALRDTIERFAIPRQPFLDLIKAFRQDQAKNRYASLAEVEQYSVYSANPVGHMVLYLGQAFSEQRARWSDSICTGLQMANFWQDVRRDALIDRVYVPLEEMERFQVKLDQLANPSPPENGRQMIESLVQRTESYFSNGLPLANDVPEWLGRNIRLFAAGGQATLSAIRSVGYDVWTRRPKVSKLCQLQLMAKEFFWRR